MTKEYLKMADAFVHDGVEALEQHIYAGYMSKHCCEYAAHAIDSHDELVAENERLRTALECTKNHFPDAAKMVPDGCVIVGRAEISMVINALNRDAEDGRLVRKEMADELIHSMERAMIAVAPKH